MQHLHQISSMMNFNKQIVKPCQAIEDQLVELIIDALDRTEVDGDGTEGLWQHITSQLIYFVLFNIATFHNVVTTLVSRVQVRLLSEFGIFKSIYYYLMFI